MKGTSKIGRIIIDLNSIAPHGKWDVTDAVGKLGADCAHLSSLGTIMQKAVLAAMEQELTGERLWTHHEQAMKDYSQKVRMLRLAAKKKPHETPPPEEQAG